MFLHGLHWIEYKKIDLFSDTNNCRFSNYYRIGLEEEHHKQRFTIPPHSSAGELFCGIDYWYEYRYQSI